MKKLKIKYKKFKLNYDLYIAINRLSKIDKLVMSINNNLITPSEDKNLKHLLWRLSETLGSVNQKIRFLNEELNYKYR